MTLREALDILELNPNNLDRQVLESTLRKNLESIELRNVMRLLEAYRKANAFINPTLATHGDVRVTMIDEPTPDGPPLNKRPAAKRLSDDAQRLKRDFVPGATFDESILKAPRTSSPPTLADVSIKATQEIMPTELPVAPVAPVMEKQNPKKQNVLMTPVDRSSAQKGVSLPLFVGVAAAGLAASFFVLGPIAAPFLSRLANPSAANTAASTPITTPTPTAKPVTPNTPNNTKPTNSSSPSSAASSTPRPASNSAGKPVISSSTTKPAVSSSTTKPAVSSNIKPVANTTTKPVTSSTTTKPATPSTKPTVSSSTSKPAVLSNTTKPVTSSNVTKPSFTPNTSQASKNAAAIARARLEAQRLEAQRLSARRAAIRAEANRQARLEAQRLATLRAVQQATARRLEQQAMARRVAQQAAAKRAVQKPVSRPTVSTRAVNQGSFNSWDRAGAVLRYPNWASIPDSVRALPSAQFRAAVYVASSPATLPGIPR